MAFGNGTIDEVPTPISKTEAMSLLRKIQEENAPTELVGEGQNQQAVVVIGFVSVAEEDANAFTIYVPGQIGITIDLEDAQLEYGDPREAPPEHQARAKRLIQFALGIKKAEWNFLIRVWNQPQGSLRR